MKALVAGIGNIFFGDDGFGVEVVRRLAARTLASDVCVQDFGLRGFDLACALSEAWDLVILVDAVSKGGAPGEVYVLEPDLNGGPESLGVTPEPHGLDPMRALQLAKAIGGISGRVLVVGCEPLSFESDGQTLALKPAVQAAVEPAIQCIEKILAEARQSSLECVQEE